MRSATSTVWTPEITWSTAPGRAGLQNSRRWGQVQPSMPASKSSLVRCPPADPDLRIHPCDPSITTTVQARRVLVAGKPVPPLELELMARSSPLSASSSLGDSTNGRAAPSRCVAPGAVSSGREHLEPVVEALAAGVAVVSHAYAASLSRCWVVRAVPTAPCGDGRPVARRRGRCPASPGRIPGCPARAGTGPAAGAERQPGRV